MRIAALLADGTVKPPMIRTLALDRAAEALTQAGERHTKGKIVLAIP